MARVSADRPAKPADRRRVGRILDRLDGVFAGRGIELSAASPWELLVATILSAQCTDQRVNQVTPGLFKRFRTPVDFASADREELERLIKSTGFFRAKAQSLTKCGRELVERFGGEVPRTMDDLVTLPGVGRKTANVILGAAFGQPSVVVDTHVKRVANRLGLSKSDDPVKIEFDLRRTIPEASWTLGSQHLLLHGRYVCVARRPRCEQCALYDLCASRDKRPRPEDTVAPKVARQRARRTGAARSATK
ncbi:MAG: endonuclease III [Nitrospirota bacterium]